MTDAAARLATALADRYRVERELGQGGMATVYLAHDLRHDREVAIKVLRAELAAALGTERFLSEIRTTARLQHPHILTLLDSGEADGVLYYVMPFVAGESLRDRLAREKQLPIAEAVRIAGEVAGALDYAHRHGVIHRDIKPENILLHDGQALVADFGIALAASKAGGARLTETGMSLGTPAYMSPEQAMGEREITARSDVYALGCVTYEMLVGEPPFTGPTAQAIVSRVMTAPAPSPSASRARVPAGVEAAVLTALEKLPADRFASAAEFAAALLQPGGAARPAGAAHPVGGARRRMRAALLLAGGAVLLAAAFAVGRLGRATTPGLPPARLALVAPRLGVVTTSTPGRQLAVTPSGDAVVYVGTSDSGNALFLQRLDAADPVEIVGSRNLRDPAVTPDGRFVIALSPEGGRRLPIGGGTPHPVPLPSTTFIGAFAPDGSYWFTTVDISGLARLTPSDSLVPLAVALERQRGLRIQQVLDDGHTALVIRASSVTPSGPGMLFDLRTGALSPLLDGPVLELRVARGELLVGQSDGSISAAPFDEKGHRILGPLVQVATGVALNSNFLLDFAVARNGTLVYSREGPPSLVLVDRTGAATVLLANQPLLHSPRFAPDGRRIAFDITTPEGRDVWIYALDRGTRTRATFAGTGHDATWSPDGRFLTFTRLLGGLAGVYRTRPGSTAPPESLFAGLHLDYTGTWLPDGRALITDASDLDGHSGGDVARIANGGRGPLEPLFASPFLERFAVPSPDGRWLAFASDKSGTEEVYVQALEGDTDQVQVSQGGGGEPVWAPDGHELYYRGVSNGRLVLRAAALRTAPDLAVAGQRDLFLITDIVGTGPHANYDVSPDGRTFAMVRRSADRHIVVIQDLPGLLHRLRSDRTATP